MEYDKEFEEIISSTGIDSRWTMKDRLWFVWQAARKDHYRIGEEVEVSFNYSPVFERAKIGAIAKTCNEYDPDRVRRIPAWTPKEGEAVLFHNTFGYAECGCVDAVVECFATVKTSNGTVFGNDVKYLRPFSADKIGKSWEEI